MALGRREDDMHVVWHDAPAVEGVPLAVEVLECLSEYLLDRRICKVARAMSSV